MNRPKHVRLRKKVMKLDFQLRKLKLEREYTRKFIKELQDRIFELEHENDISNTKRIDQQVKDKQS